ncbi:MAG TPA: hypothetical protein VF773_01245 [Verrucomicrobiae bacterium]
MHSQNGGMKGKKLVIILIVSAVCIAAVLMMLMLRMARDSVVGRWHEVGVAGAEQMTFSGGGDVWIGDSLGSYTWIDEEHLRVEFGMGSPRLVRFSARDGTMQWTNEQLGLVLRYTNEPGSLVKVGIGKVLGF